MEHSIRKEQECRLFETWKQTSMYSEETYANFLDKVGEEISIGINKGWTITA